MRNRLLVLFGIAALTAACGEESTGPESGDGDIASFEIRRSGALVYEWEGTVAADDTIRLPPDDSIPVEFRWFDNAGDRVTLSASSDAQLTVTTPSPGIARWVPDGSSASAGSIVTGDLLLTVTTALSVELEIGDDAQVSTSLIPVKVTP